MTLRVTLREAAEEDLRHHALVIGERNPDAAMRFLDAADAAFAQLATHPQIGRRRRFNSPHLKELRSWAIPGFGDFLIFYIADDIAVRVIRVLHGAQDIESVFDE